MNVPTFQNLGTAEDPFWQRASMHCKVCGGFSSCQECWDCQQWFARESLVAGLWPDRKNFRGRYEEIRTAVWFRSAYGGMPLS